MEFLDGFDDASDANRNDFSKDYEWTSAEECQDATQRAEQLAVALQRPSRASLIVSVYHELMSEICLDICFSMHRSVKLGLFCTPRADASATQPQFLPDGSCACPMHAIETDPSKDVFGNYHPSASTDEIQCDVCDRKLQAARYAPHLAKCMGKGRTAARNASRRMSSAANAKVDGLASNGFDDDDDPFEDHALAEAKKKKKKKKKVASDVAPLADSTKKKKKKKQPALAAESQAGAMPMLMPQPSFGQLHGMNDDDPFGADQMDDHAHVAHNFDDDGVLGGELGDDFIRDGQFVDLT